MQSNDYTTVGVLNNFMKIYYLRKKINNEL